MKTFRALSTRVSVTVDDEVVLAAVAAALVSPYPTAETADVQYELSHLQVRRGGSLISLPDPRDVVPAFELDLYEQVLARAEPGWILHAAALEVDGRALVLCGPSGAGKTTMALELTRRGHRLLTEEMVWLGPTGVVRGLPRPIHVPAGSPHRERVPSHWTQLPYPIRAADGSVRENLLVVPPPEVFQLSDLQLHTLVRIGHGPDRTPELVQNPLSVVFQRLWDRSLRQDDSGLEAATAVLRTFGAYELYSTRPDEAVALLEPLLK